MAARKKSTAESDKKPAPAPRKKAVAAAADAPVTTRKRKAAAPPAPLTKTPRRKKVDAADVDGAPVTSSGKNLVIVESPAKAKTIEKYLGGGFKVLASYGHVRDLPKRRRKGEQIAGINIDAGWVPTYVVGDRDDAGNSRRRTPKDILAELKREANRSTLVYLATDPDREGEAIAWHIEDELKLDNARTFRITFNEITRPAVQNAMAHPGKIDMDRVHAQEARRILDRVVGYPLSNLISRKVVKQLSAGRVQSVALRLVVDREREIEAFKTEEYWEIHSLLAPTGTVPFTFKPFTTVLSKKKPGEDKPGDEKVAELKDPEAKDAEGKDDSDEKSEGPTLPTAQAGTFLAKLAEWDGQKFAASSTEMASVIAEALDRATYVVSKVEPKDRSEKPQAPFTTSTLQQQASIRLRFRAEHTMRIAQRLYEGVDLNAEGPVALITYMRTDSTRVSNEALQAVRGHIGTTYGPKYVPEKPNAYQSGKSAQEAHEAIRPTDLSYTPQRVEQLLPVGLERRQDFIRLYTLIYNRFVASQMAPALFAVTNVEVTATAAVDGKPTVGLFRAQGRIMKFDGYRRVMPPAGRKEDATLPALNDGLGLDRLDLIASQHYTQPPPRFNEASLVRALEDEGIGRPSTYASIIGKITSDKRGYIEVKERRFFATKLGMLITDLLVEHFPKVMDLKFTSQMEEELDQIERRKAKYAAVLTDFWGPFSEALTQAESKMPSQRGVETGENCPKCGKPLVKNFSKKTGREFIGCSGFKEGCKYIKPGEGEEARPEPVVTEVPCPNCGKPMLERMGKRGPFLGCSGYPECKTTMNFDAEGKPVLASRPTDHVCEKCGKPMVLREGPRGPFLGCTGYPKCRNLKDVDAQGNPMKPVDTGVLCEKCNAPMAVKRGPRGPFLGCSAYPKCRSTKPMTPELKEKLKDVLPPAPVKQAVPEVEVTETCPECDAAMKLRRGPRGFFLGCSKFPKCRGRREVSAEMLEQVTAT
ncbi:MAG: type I DNA topoisomerase [Gemmataceae bacterium]|nr:type I DNA topoisomerase [Gemmataceae bacterium]